MVCFFEFLTLFTLWVIIFSFLIHFWWLLVCQMHREEGFKFCLDTRNSGVLPLDPACPECLSVWSLTGLPYNLPQFSICLGEKSKATEKAAGYFMKHAGSLIPMFSNTRSQRWFFDFRIGSERPEMAVLSTPQVSSDIEPAVTQQLMNSPPR